MTQDKIYTTEFCLEPHNRKYTLTADVSGICDWNTQKKQMKCTPMNAFNAYSQIKQLEIDLIVKLPSTVPIT